MCIPLLEALCCLLPQLVELGSEHLLLESIHAENCAWVSDWKLVHLHGNKPLGNCPQLVAVLFKGISRSLDGRLEHWQISLCCLLTAFLFQTLGEC